MIYTKSKKIIYKLFAMLMTVMVILPYNMAFANQTDRDTGFDTGLPTWFGNGSIYSMTTQSDGKIIVWGGFTTYKWVAARSIARLNTDWSRDTSFDIWSGFNNMVVSLAVQSDGRIIVWWYFTTYKWNTANWIIRLNNNWSIDSSFVVWSGFSVWPSTIAIQSDGKIIAGGGSITYKWVQVNWIIRLNTDWSIDNSFVIWDGFDQGLGDIKIQSDGKIIVWGNFTTYKSVAANRIIRLNTDWSRDTSFDMWNWFNSMVKTIAIQSDGKVLVGGQFTTYSWVSARSIARLNTDWSRDTSFDSWNWTDSWIDTIAIQSDGKIIAAGGFTTYKSLDQYTIIRLNDDWSKDSSFDAWFPMYSSIKKILIKSNGKILAGWDFITYLNTNWTKDTSFDTWGGFDWSVNDIAIQSDGKIIVWGNFTTYKWVSAKYIVRLNSNWTIDNSFVIWAGFLDWDGFDWSVNDIAIQSDGKIIVWWYFTTYSWSIANNIVRLNSNWTIDNSFNMWSGFDNSVNNINIQSDGKIITRWPFSTYKWVSINPIIRLNSDGTIDSSFDMWGGFDWSVNDIAIQSDGKIVIVWAFSTYSWINANKIIRLNSNLSIDSSFDYWDGFNSTVKTIAVQPNGKIIVHWYFSTYKWVAVGRIMRLNTDWSRDTSFNMWVWVDEYLYKIIVQNDGKILIWWDFSTYNWESARSFVILNSSWFIDSSFDYWFSNNSSTVINTIVNNSGKVMIGWSFDQYKWLPVNNLISIYGESDIIIVPNSTNTTTVKSEFTTKWYTQSNGDLIWSKSFSLSLTDWNIPVNLSLKNNNIKLSIPADTQFKKADNVTNYDWIVSVPVSRTISSIADKPVLSSFKVGSSESLKLVWGEATLSTPVAKSVWDPVIVYYSENNGASRYPHTITSVSDVSGQPTVSFTTNHFTDFAILDGEWMFTINYDAASTISDSVTLNISTTPPSSYMRFSNDWTNRSAREAYATSKSWTLSEWYGTKTVYAEFDVDGDQTAEAQTSDTITYNAPWGGGGSQGQLILEIGHGTWSCQYGTSLNLGAQVAWYSAKIFSWSFASSFRCEDKNGTIDDRVLSIQSSLLTNASNSSYTIPAVNVELQNSPAHIVDGNCAIYTGTTSRTPINSPTSILGKNHDMGAICKIQADTVTLKVTTATNQAVGIYTGTLTIDVPNFN